jgi:fucose 4-O-acetylase-like acetyltransferase
METTPTTRLVDAWIYSFHMPLFFFLSGLFLFRSQSKPWGDFIENKVRRIAYPYFVWSIVTILIKSVLGSAVNRSYDLTDLPFIFYRPIDQFWFLYALFVALIVISGLLKLGARPWAIVALTILIYPGVLPISSYGSAIIVEIRVMMIYVAIGLIVGMKLTDWNSPKMHAGWFALAAFVGFIVPLLAAWRDLTMQYPFLGPLLALSGIFGVICLAKMIETSAIAAAVQYLGRHSLEIFVAHTIGSAGTRIFLFKVAHITEPAIIFPLATIAGLLVPLAMLQLFSTMGFRYGFTWPKKQLLKDRAVSTV